VTIGVAGGRLRAVLALGVGVTLAAVVAFPASGQLQTSSFSGTYASQQSTWWGLRTCRNTAAFAGREPATGSGYPVFVYLPGTGEPYEGPVGTTFADAMAVRGFVAASVQYEDWQFYAEGIEGNAACIFGTGEQSAVSQLCARPKADCSKGVVVSGFSQGAVIAAQARSHNRQVRAAYLLGYNEERISAWEGTARWRMAVVPPDGTRALPNDRIRIVDGVVDAPADLRDELNDQTGRSCAATAFDCLAADGSGWYVVQNSEVADGLAEHCYFHGPYFCPREPPFDPTWLTSATAPWALTPNLDWLESTTGVPGGPVRVAADFRAARAAGIIAPSRR
jgi:hypothetical protein